MYECLHKDSNQNTWKPVALRLVITGPVKYYFSGFDDKLLKVGEMALVKTLQ